MADETTPAEGGTPATGDTGQADLGDAGKKALDAERKARRDAEARLKELEPLARKAQELEEQGKSELERLASKVSAAELEAADAMSSVLRLEVAMDKAPEGMSVAQVRKLAKRLQGSSREELEADADELFSEFVTDEKKPVTKKPAADLKRGGPESVSEPEDPLLASLKSKVGVS